MRGEDDTEEAGGSKGDEHAGNGGQSFFLLLLSHLCGSTGYSYLEDIYRVEITRPGSAKEARDGGERDGGEATSDCQREPTHLFCMG